MKVFVGIASTAELPHAVAELSAPLNEDNWRERIVRLAMDKEHGVSFVHCALGTIVNTKDGSYFLSGDNVAAIIQRGERPHGVFYQVDENGEIVGFADVLREEEV